MSWEKNRVVPALVVAATLGIGILIGTVISHGVRAARGVGGAPGAALLTDPSPVELSNSFARIAAQLEPAVVNINTVTTIHISRRDFHAPQDSPLGDFFDHLFQFEGPNSAPHDFRQQSLGSGVILDRHGYILTNYHVIMQDGMDRPVDRIRVQLHGDDNDAGYEAKVIGTDKLTDLAVIKIEAGHSLSTAQMGDSGSMRVGDWVLAIGSPFGLESTVTAGIISAKGRSIEGGPEGQFKRFLQTDAAINPGNSGGPLVNMAGQVIGINTAIATRRGSSDGVGFAIPSDTARKIYNAIISTGSVRRGAIGVTFHNENNPVKLHMFGADHGVVVDGVEQGSPAERAGVKMGDVIVSVDGKPIRNGDDLVGVISDTQVGNKLKLGLLRNGKPLSTEVVVGDRSQVIASMRGDAQSQGGGEQAKPQGGVLGVTVKALPAAQAQDIARQLHLSAPQGVLVSSTDPTGFASDLGVLRGDVILSVNRQPVKSLDDFQHWQTQLKSGSDVLFLIARRTGEHSYTTLFLADRLP